MRVLILGGDGFLGWPTAMDCSAAGHTVHLVDNYLRRDLATSTRSEALVARPRLPRRTDLFYKLTGSRITFDEGNCADYEVLSEVVRRFEPDALVHYAEQPSAPYSMYGRTEAELTLRNNLGTTFNVVWACLEHAPSCHIVKLGTMGEYGTPNIDIEEGWLEVEHRGRRDRFLYPRQAGSLYHTTKILDTDLLWFYVRHGQLAVTDLMQGPVYGLSTLESDMDDALAPNFHYDDIFGTVVNRFLVQAVAGIPLTVYGGGGQTRGYLNLKDTLQCVRLALEQPAPPGELRILNQFTETFTVHELAQRVQRAAAKLGLVTDIQYVDNPRNEEEEHYYNPANSALRELGLEPNYMTDEVLADMLERILPFRGNIDPQIVLPRVSWGDGAK